MKRRKTDCFESSFTPFSNANPKSLFPDLFLGPVLIRFLITVALIQVTFCQAQFPFAYNPYPFSPFNTIPFFPGSINSGLQWPPSPLALQSYQSLSQFNQVPSPFIGQQHLPVNNLALRQGPLSQQHFFPTYVASVVPDSIEESASPFSPPLPAPAGAVVGGVGIDGSLGSGSAGIQQQQYPWKDVTGIWNKLTMTGGKNLLQSSGTSFIPGSSSSPSSSGQDMMSLIQGQRMVSTPALTALPFNPFLPFDHDPEYDFQNRYQVDPVINNGLQLLPVIDHRSSIERNSLDTKLKLQTLQNQMFANELQMNPLNSIQHGQSLALSLFLSLPDSDTKLLSIFLSNKSKLLTRTEYLCFLELRHRVQYMVSCPE